MATLNMTSPELSEASKHDYSRPASTSSGTSVASASDNIGAAGKLGESLDSFSAMPTPRNTFLTPPTGLNLGDRGAYSGGAATWDSAQHQEQLQRLIERKGVPRDGSADTEASAGTGTSADTERSADAKRSADRTCSPGAAALATQLASYDDSYFLLNRPAAAEDGPRSRAAAAAMLRQLARGATGAGMPLALARPAEALTEMEDALIGIVARRQIPTRTHVFWAGGAGSSAAAGATAGGPALGARRKQRQSLAPGEHDGGGGGDDKRSMRSRASVASGELAGLASATPYGDLNGHIDRLTACISRLQPADGARARAATGHARHGSVSSSAYAPAAASTQSLIGQPLGAPAYDDAGSRLSPVTEHVPVRSRSSSRLSAVSGASAESRRRIVVGEVPTSAQFPSPFGSAVGSAPLHQQHAASPAAPGSGGASMHSQESSDTAAAARPALGAAVSVRDITPAGRLALWIQLHTAGDAQRATLWRRRHWQRRFMVFAGNVLYLFKSSAPAATALAVVRLGTATIVCVNDSFHGRSWVVEITQPGAQPQSWYLQLEVRSEMIVLLKQLKAAIGELQVLPDVERREAERMRNRRRQRAEAPPKADVCPWEAAEFSDSSNASNASPVPRIADADLFSSDDEAAARAHRAAQNAPPPPRPARLQIADYTGTGGIAEWGAHRLQVPYSPVSAGLHPAQARSLSADPAAAPARRPSLADVLAPPASAVPDIAPSPRVSPHTPPQTVRGSMMLRADASALIDQMFASASHASLHAVREED